MTKKTREDYLRAIYYFQEQGKSVRSVDIAKYLEISKASVSEMLKKLIKGKYIKMAPYSEITFTAKGLQEAKKLTYKHRVIEVFLKDILHCPLKNIHQGAHELEHAFSDSNIKKLAKFLNNPQYCPDGKKIPKIYDIKWI